MIQNEWKQHNNTQNTTTTTTTSSQETPAGTNGLRLLQAAEDESHVTKTEDVT